MEATSESHRSDPDSAGEPGSDLSGARPAGPGELLVVDVGGTRTKSALSSAEGLDALVIRATPRDYVQLFSQLAALHSAYGAPAEWAMALPGNLDSQGRWKGFPASLAEAPVDVAAELIRHNVPAPTICQDTEAALLGEADGGSIFLINLSTGIGCGATEHGVALRDREGALAGLWNAHISLDERGPECSRCGNRGCASVYASLRALSERLGSSITPAELRASTEPRLRLAYGQALWAVGELALRCAREFEVPEVRLAGGSAQAWNDDLVAAVQQALADSGVRVSLSSGAEQTPLRGLDPRLR